jgi:hypothetical protein
MTTRILCATLALAGMTGEARAFTQDNHKEITAAALAVLTDPATKASLRDASIIGDTNPDSWVNSAAHYDNCAWYEGQAWVTNHRNAAVTAAYNVYLSNTAANRQAVWDNLGYVIHAVEDFYAHSRWVENNNWGAIANLDGAPPSSWVSGTYPDDNPKDCPAGTPSHGSLNTDTTTLNKDSDIRPGFWEARSDAIVAVQQQLALFQNRVNATYPSQAATIFQCLGIRAQPRVVDEALYWPPTGKVYFFQGGQYKRYDLVADAVDAGYPRPIVPGWIRLDPFATGIDAAFAGASNKTFFFKGSNYIRYNNGGNGTAEGADPGYPAAISSRWSGVFTSNIEAALPYPNGKLYFFKGSSYTRYTPGATDSSAGTADPGYPLPIVGNWPGLEPFAGGVDAVFISPVNGKVYFFRGGHYIRYDVGQDKADPGYPLPIGPNWPGL